MENNSADELKRAAENEAGKISMAIGTAACRQLTLLGSFFAFYKPTVDSGPSNKLRIFSIVCYAGHFVDAERLF